MDDRGLWGPTGHVQRTASHSVNTGHCFSTQFFSDWLYLLPCYLDSHEEVGAPQAQVAHPGEPWVLSGLLAVESRVSGHGEGDSHGCACALALLRPLGLGRGALGWLLQR